MKRFFIAVGFVLVLTSCNQTKIAYVNIEEILKEYEGSKNAEELMKAQSDRIMAELEPMTREFQAKVMEFQKNAPKLSATAKAEQEQQLMQEQQMIQQRQQMAQQQVQQEGRQIYIDMDKKVDSLISVFAKSKGYSFVLGTSASTKSVIYGDEAANITDEVLKSLNSSYALANENTTKTEKIDSLSVK